MESFFRETLKQHVPQPPVTYEVNSGACTCVQSLGEIAFNGRNISLFRVGCERPDQMKSEFSGLVHSCICDLNGSMSFMCLIEVCRACYHECICGFSVVPNEDQGGARAGQTVCRADEHRCLCKKLSPESCIATKRHKCSCARSPTTCKLNRDEIPRDRNHICRCDDSWYQNVKCKVHMP